MVARNQKLRVDSLRFQGNVYETLLRPLQEGRYDELPGEVLVEGPTGTGKTICILALIKYYARTFPGANILVIRRIKADLGGSVMQALEEEVMRWEDPWDRYALTNNGPGIPSHRSRDVYKYPNGSKIWMRGLDQWSRVRSMSYDLIFVNEATEIEEEQLEGLHTRKRKRIGVDVPWRGLICDTNPEHPTHWLNQRAIRGDTVRVKTTLRDNPGFYNIRRGEFTEPGNEYIGELRKRLRGHRAQRYIDGIWMAAEGQILDFEVNRHLFRGRITHTPGKLDRIEFTQTHEVLGDFVEIVGYAASYDWGDRHAGTLQVWAVDKESRQYLVEEVYHSKRPLQWWGNWAVTLWKKWGLQFIVCDNAAKDTINHFNHELEKEGGGAARIAIPCVKRSGNRQESNLEVLRNAFADDADGKPSVFIMEDALAHAPDTQLSVQRFQDEIPGYVYAAYEPGRHSGRPEDRPDRSCVDDGLDACTYFRVHMLGGRRVATKLRQDNSTRDPWEVMREHYWDQNRAAS